MREKLYELYDTLGERGTMFVIYAFSVMINALFSIGMTLPSMSSDELSIAGIAAGYGGRDWSALLDKSGNGSGYFQALFYAPLFFVFRNPYALYKGMLIVNGLLISFLPLIAYYMAAKLGVESVFHKVLISLCCGMSALYIANSKFIRGDALTGLLYWLTVLCLLSAWDKKTGGTRTLMSMLTALLCILSYAADERMFALVPAVIVTIIVVRVLFKEQMVNIPIFSISLIVFFAADRFASTKFQSSSQATGRVVLNAQHFFGELFSQLYAFMTSTMGFGALALALSAVMFLTFVKEGFKKCKVEVPENGTKVYIPIKHKYSERAMVISLLQFFAVFFMVVEAALFSDGNELFGNYTDAISPFSVFFAMTFIFIYGINWSELIKSMGIYAYSCICFAIMGYPIVKNDTDYLKAAVPVLFPIRTNSEHSMSMDFVIMSSCVFSAFALLMVFTSCAKNHGRPLISASLFITSIYATAVTGIIFIPRVGKENLDGAKDYINAAELLYNDAQSPPIIVYDAEPRLAAAAQFLNPETKVNIAGEDDKFPEACLIIAENGVSPLPEGGFYDAVGKTDKYTIYAFGDGARDFYRYISSKQQSTSES